MEYNSIDLLRLRLRQREIIIPIGQIQLLLRFVQSTFPLEASGIILGQELGKYAVLYFIETNIAENTPFTFCIRDSEIFKISESIKGSDKKIYGCFHSHIFGAARPSIYDFSADKNMGDLWLIYSVKFSDFKIYKWSGIAFQNQSFKIIR